ncbi:hypothetical protein DPMN_131073 [Dreissena polymorpha]|uniref:Uncharacterized protein n=1 Tax=Dreissena polymorpha TaxID=45954 RepID=A0A9D4JY53_DREPO|nr:hypothetical protein DPMN_131073 [Dreissena polymorpha]
MFDPGAPKVEIDRIVIREVQYQLEVNWCRNEEVKYRVKGKWIGELLWKNSSTPEVKGNFGWVWPMWAGRRRIDRIVIRIVQYQLEVNRCNFGWVWPILAGRPRIDRIVIRKVQYQLEVNRCRNEEVIVKGNLGWVWPMWVVCLRVGIRAMHIEIDRIVIREFQYKFEVNQCRNEEIIVKGNFGVGLVIMGPCIVEIDRIVIREVHYKFELNRCRNEEVNPRPNPHNFRPRDQIKIPKMLKDGPTDKQTAEITTISPRFSKIIGIILWSRLHYDESLTTVPLLATNELRPSPIELRLSPTSKYWKSGHIVGNRIIVADLHKEIQHFLKDVVVEVVVVV